MATEANLQWELNQSLTVLESDESAQAPHAIRQKLTWQSVPFPNITFNTDTDDLDFNMNTFSLLECRAPKH